MKMRIAAAFIGLLSIMSAAYADEPGSVTVERNATVKMRDGILLRADIYRPSRKGTYPVLLYRTPYDKSGVLPFGLRGANEGYVVISEDVRGRYASDGDWYPFLHESEDGYDTVEWAAALPTPMEKSGCSGCHMMARPKCLLQSLILRILSVFVRGSLPAIITTDGSIRGAPLSNGSMKRGPQGFQRTF